MSDPSRVSEGDGGTVSSGTLHRTALLTHIPLELLVKEIVYFFHQKNKRRCTQQGGPLGRAPALFDLGSALIVKNYSIMDKESVKTSPAQH